MRLRRTVTLTLTLLLSGCTDDSKKTPPGQAVEIIAGGGTDPSATEAVEAKVTGSRRDLEVDRKGVVRILTVDNKRVTIWVVPPDGELQRIRLDPQIQSARQLAVADDGTLFVSHSLGGVGLVSRITAAGKAVRVIGDGSDGFTADGGSGLGAAASIDGIAVDREGRLVFAERRFYPVRVKTAG